MPTHWNRRELLRICAAAPLARALARPLRAESPPGFPLYVTVQPDGPVVAGLTARNFRIRRGGEPVPVQSAAPAGPAQVVLLVENSAASWRYLNDVNSAMRGFLDHAPQGHDYALVSFGKTTQVEEGMTTESRRIGQAYSAIQPSAYPDTDTYDSLAKVLDGFEQLPAGRQIVILVGLGIDRFSRVRFEDLASRLEASPVLIYSIAIGAELRRSPQLAEANEPDPREGEMFLRMLARKTGGAYYCPSCDADFASSMKDILDSFGKQYRLGAAGLLPPPGVFAKLDVQAFQVVSDRRRDFRIRVREGVRSAAAPG